MRFNKNIKQTNIVLSVSATLALAVSGPAQTLPGTLSYSWVGNSHMSVMFIWIHLVVTMLQP